MLLVAASAMLIGNIFKLEKVILSCQALQVSGKEHPVNLALEIKEETRVHLSFFSFHHRTVGMFSTC
jgi:hypothetical protein